MSQFLPIPRLSIFRMMFVIQISKKIGSVIMNE